MVSSTDPSHPPLSTLSQAVKTKAGAKNDDIGSGDAARDVGYKRHFSKEQLEDWKTPLEIVKDNM